MNTTAKLLCSLTLLTAALATARAGSPEYLNYQGLLNGADGQPLPTGNYTNEFNIYDQAVGGDKVWGPFLFDGTVGDGHGPLVPVVNGRFNVIIGPLDALAAPLSTAFASTNRFVEIKVNGGPPILPRKQFLSTPYAFKANTADQAALATSATVATSVSDVNVALLDRSPQTFSGQNNFTGNIGLGTTATPTARLDVRGDIRLGPTGQYYAPAAGENLRIVRGIVRGNTSAGLNKGTGYTVNNFVGGQGQPETTVTFSQAFADVPAIALTTENIGEAWHVSVINASTTNFNVRMWRSDSVRHNAHFHFTATGPR